MEGSGRASGEEDGPECRRRTAGAQAWNVPSSSVRTSRGRLAGPGPASVWALTATLYSVHRSRFSSSCWELPGGRSVVRRWEAFPPSVGEYWTEYLVIIPFCNSTGGASQLTRMLVELGLEHLTSWGGAEGSDWRDREEEEEEGDGGVLFN